MSVSLDTLRLVGMHYLCDGQSGLIHVPITALPHAGWDSLPCGISSENRRTVIIVYIVAVGSGSTVS